MHDRFFAQEQSRSWFQTPDGVFARKRMHILLRKQISAWQRRSRSVLVTGAGDAAVLELLWQAGFDVTGADNNPAALRRVRPIMGNRVEYVFSQPDSLPFDDHNFDYSVVVDALEFWDDPEAALAEIQRVTCSGCLLIFPSSWSWLALEFRKVQPAAEQPRFFSPRKAQSLIAALFPEATAVWAAVLPLGRSLWRFPQTARLHQLSLPWGAYAAVRIDYAPMRGQTPLLLPAAPSGTATSCNSME